MRWEIWFAGILALVLSERVPLSQQTKVCAASPILRGQIALAYSASVEEQLRQNFHLKWDSEMSRKKPYVCTSKKQCVSTGSRR